MTILNPRQHPLPVTSIGAVTDKLYHSAACIDKPKVQIVQSSSSRLLTVSSAPATQVMAGRIVQSDSRNLIRTPDLWGNNEHVIMNVSKEYIYLCFEGNNEQNADESYYDAAIRHWIDGHILEEQEEYDNAVCMQGFVAECALKAILETGYPIEKIRKCSHWGEALLHDIEMMLLGDMALTVMIDSATGLRLSRISFPEILFKNHPERRYYKDEVYREEEAISCRIAVEGLIREMARLYVDGYIGG